MCSISAAGGSTHDAADDHPDPDADAAEQHQILHDRGQWIFTVTTRAGEAHHAQAEHREDRAADREIAALARGARRTEEGKGEGRERERIDRRHEAVMQLGAELAGQLLIDRIVLRAATSAPRDSARGCRA